MNMIFIDLFPDYDTLYCMRESVDNKEDDADTTEQVLAMTTNIPDTEEEIDNEKDEYDDIAANADAQEDSETMTQQETTTDSVENSKESEGYGIKALIKYKIKKVKNTWSNIKSLLRYPVDII